MWFIYWKQILKINTKYGSEYTYSFRVQKQSHAYASIFPISYNWVVDVFAGLLSAKVVIGKQAVLWCTRADDHEHGLSGFESDSEYEDE